MARVDDLRHQHDKLHAGVDAMASLRDQLGLLGSEAVLAGVDRTLDFFRHDAGPHAQAEELVLYPEVARTLNVHLSETLVREHREMNRLVGVLGEERAAMARGTGVPSRLHRTLTSLVTVMRAHLRQEEEVLLTLLDEHLSDAQAYELYERMEVATFDAMVALGTAPR